MENMPPFLNYLQELYNSLAVLYSEFEDHQTGSAYAEKAEKIYHLIKDMNPEDKAPQQCRSNLFRYLLHQAYDPDSTNSNKHSFYFEGGINL